ncbi:MAG: histidine kinase [Spirochaetales bacterium]|nr:histidine kinase [Spirochaetales bacterium]
MFKLIFEPASLKSRITRFFIFLLVLLLGITGYSQYSAYQTLSRYEKTFTGYDHLLSFYENVELMNVGMTNYIYTNSEADLLTYQIYLEAAFDNLENLGERANDELLFRFSRLNNMLMTYDEHVEALLVGGEQRLNQKAYDSFGRLRELIQDTYPAYTRLLTSEMKSTSSLLAKNWQNQLIITLLVSLFLLVVSGMFVVRLIQSITRPIDSLIKNMGLIKGGEFGIESYNSTCSEINTLLTSFEEMAIKVDSNIKQIHENTQMERHIIEVENENLRISQLLTEAQLVALQHQMNPHFIFNTLSTISKLAYMEGAQKSYDLMIRTSRVLRYGLEMGSRTSTLSLELNSVEDYFEIQRIRMGERIKFNVEVEENFANVPMPGMIIQPLIENCIIHGVHELIGPAYITVSAAKRGGRAIVTIEDNGVGIEEALLEKLNRINVEEERALDEDEAQNGNKRMSLGIQNVRKRLALYYKEDFRLFFESDIGCGTVITLDLPIRG